MCECVFFLFNFFFNFIFFLFLIMNKNISTGKINKEYRRFVCFSFKKNVFAMYVVCVSMYSNSSICYCVCVFCIYCYFLGFELGVIIIKLFLFICLFVWSHFKSISLRMFSLSTAYCILKYLYVVCALDGVN